MVLLWYNELHAWKQPAAFSECARPQRTATHPRTPARIPCSCVNMCTHTYAPQHTYYVVPPHVRSARRSTHTYAPQHVVAHGTCFHTTYPYMYHHMLSHLYLHPNIRTNAVRVLLPTNPPSDCDHVRVSQACCQRVCPVVPHSATKRHKQLMNTAGTTVAQLCSAL